jgi:hypothetical protein
MMPMVMDVSGTSVFFHQGLIRMLKMADRGGLQKPGGFFFFAVARYISLLYGVIYYCR